MLHFQVNDVSYRFEFESSARDGYLLTYNEIEAALRGDVDSVQVGRDGFHHVVVELPRPHSTPAQKAAATRRFRQWHEAEVGRRQREEQALLERRRLLEGGDTKAWGTLKAFLNPKQLKTLNRHGFFDLVGSAGTPFRIMTGVAGNVWWLDSDGQQMGQLCAHCESVQWPSGRGRHHHIPTADHMLTQMLELRADEDRWLQIAHCIGGRAHPAQKDYDGLRRYVEERW